jgi:simple sugar transport system permease protein
MNVFDSGAMGELAASTVRSSTPLIFAALGGWVCERSGIINIALEGLMLIGAFAAASAAFATHSPWIGMAAGIGAGIALAAVYGACVIPLRADQIVAGVAINLLAAGSAPFLSKVFFDSTASTPSLEISSRFHAAPIWIALGAVVVMAIFEKRTPAGLWLRFAGENPDALAAAGIRVRRVRWAAVLTSGALAGMGGVSLSIFLASSFSRNMTAGRGFMAVAALIFGKWRPVPAVLACLLFGFTDEIQIRLQGVVLWGSDPVPVQFVQILPYVVTMLVLAGFVGKSRAPKSLGLPYLPG